MPKPEPLPESIRRSPLVALIRYAREYKLDLYADAYRIRPAERAARERTPAWNLETLRESVFWLRVEGDVLMARHRDYFWLRPSEISERALAPLEAKLRQNAEISLDEWAQLAISLSPMQTARVNEMYEIAGQAVAHDTPLPLGVLVDIRPALEFWASLTPAQRRDALASKRLAYEQLGSASRQSKFNAAAVYLPPKFERLTGEHGIVLTSATERVAAQGENSIKRIDIRTPSARREPPHFRLETQSIEPAPRYTVEGDEITAQPLENTAPMQALRLVFVGKEQERVYLLISKP